MIRILKIILLSSIGLCTLSACGVYSFTGANIAGKTLSIQNLENTSSNIVPTLSPVLTEKIRSRILSQTGLTPVQDNADYEISGNITGYNVSVSGVGDAQTAQASQNRLTITVQIEYKNKLDEKTNFKQSFSRFADFNANAQLTSVETRLIEEIGDQLADDIFNKAFVNW
jgi:maltose-binding protein MalE